jgi:hypothetical protein
VVKFEKDEESPDESHGGIPHFPFLFITTFNLLNPNVYKAYNTQKHAKIFLPTRKMEMQQNDIESFLLDHDWEFLGPTGVDFISAPTSFSDAVLLPESNIGVNPT